MKKYQIVNYKPAFFRDNTISESFLDHFWTKFLNFTRNSIKIRNLEVKIVALSVEAQ